ncbi:hypothetical protein CBL_02866 [Carabus blaptoides fortunei]
MAKRDESAGLSSDSEQAEAFNGLADQEKQDSYPSSLITVSQIKRRRKNVLKANSQRNSTFKYSFGHIRKDTFKKCDTLENRIEGAESEEEKKSFETQKKLHILKSEWFYKELKEKSKQAQENDHIEVLSFDFQQNMPLPKVPSWDTFYLRQLWVQNFRIHSAKNKMGHFFINMESPKTRRVFLKYLALSLMTPHLKERGKIVSLSPRVKSILSKYADIEETEGEPPIKIRARCVLCPKAKSNNTTIVCSKYHAHSCKAHVQTTHVCNKCTEQEDSENNS